MVEVYILGYISEILFSSLKWLATILENFQSHTSQFATEGQVLELLTRQDSFH